MVLGSKQQAEFEFTSDVNWDLIEGAVKNRIHPDLNSITREFYKIVDALYRAYGFCWAESAQFLVHRI